MIDLYTWHTPNGRKVSILLEELKVEYKVYPINPFAEGEIINGEKVIKSLDNIPEEIDIVDVFRPSKGDAKVVIGNGVTITGEIKKADEVQIDGEADVTMKTDNVVIGLTGKCKGNIETHNADIWGSFDGDLKASGTLTIQAEGNATGTIEYQNMQIKLGGKLSGDIKMSDKIQPIKKETKESDNKSSISLQESIKTGDK